MAISCHPPHEAHVQGAVKTKLDWDEEVTNHLKKKHQRWRKELCLLATVNLPRHYYQKKKPLTVELHGYCDASMEAYAAVIYVRATYTAGPPSIPPGCIQDQSSSSEDKTLWSKSTCKATYHYQTDPEHSTTRCACLL